MRSKEIAEHAGVSVRTLRHYHQIGLLPEPARDANGYRRYDIQHLVRLLRIGRLSALGLPLADLPPLLDGDDAQRATILDRLDDGLARQIEHLKKQRRIVAALRDGAGPLDISPDLAAPLLLLEAGQSDGSKLAGREQAVLIAHMFSEKGRHSLAGLLERLAASDLAGIVHDLSQRFDRLGPTTGDREVEDLAKAYIRHLGPWLHEAAAVFDQFADKDTDGILRSHALETSTPAQQKFLVRVSEKLWPMGMIDTE